MFYEKFEGKLIISLKITTKTSKTQFLLPEKDANWAKLKISAVPEKGKANKAIIKYLARCLNVSKQSIEITKGETSPLKTITIQGEPDELIKKIISLSEN